MFIIHNSRYWQWELRMRKEKKKKILLCITYVEMNIPLKNTPIFHLQPTAIFSLLCYSLSYSLIILSPSFLSFHFYYYHCLLNHLLFLPFPWPWWAHLSFFFFYLKVAKTRNHHIRFYQVAFRLKTVESHVVLHEIPSGGVVHQANFLFCLKHCIE